MSNTKDTPIDYKEMNSEFEKHHEKIAEVIVRCIGVRSGNVHWREVAPNKCI